MAEIYIETEKENSSNITEVIREFKIWFIYLKSQWIKILVMAFVGAAVGLTIAWLTPPKYTSKLSFILEEGKSSAGGISAIAGQFGLDLGSSMGNSSLLSGENIVGLLKSRKFTSDILTSSYDGNKYSLADRYAEIYGLRDDWKKSKKIAKEIYFPAGDKHKYSRLQDSLLQVIEFRILKDELAIVRPDKKMSFFNVSMSCRDELLAKYFSERLVKDVVDFYIEAKTRRLRSNVSRLQFRADSIAALLNNKTYTAAAAQSAALDINPAYQTAGVVAEVSSRNKAMIGTIYAEIVKNLEIQKITLSQETPVIQVVDEVELPLTIEKKSKLLFLIIGGILASVICIVILISFRFYHQVVKKSFSDIKSS